MRDWTIEKLLENTSQTGSQPGGGGIAGLVAALAAALDQMVLRIQVGKKDLSPDQQALMGDLEQKKSHLLDLAQADGESFHQVIEAWRMDKKDPRRAEKEQAGYRQAIAVPLEMTEQVVELLEEQLPLMLDIRSSVGADLLAASLFCQAAIDICLVNIWFNQKYIKDPQEQAQIQRQARHLWSRTCQATEQIQSFLKESWSGFYEWRKEN